MLSPVHIYQRLLSLTCRSGEQFTLYNKNYSEKNQVFHVSKLKLMNTCRLNISVNSPSVKKDNILSSQ